jgi:protein-S-isoprenylcysteine O-methyltransferase Ste14
MTTNELKEKSNEWKNCYQIAMFATFATFFFAVFVNFSFAWVFAFLCVLSFFCVYKHIKWEWDYIKSHQEDIYQERKKQILERLGYE